MHGVFTVPCLAVLLITPGSLWAKGATVKITFTGPGLATPLDTAGREVGSFPVWAGPGVRVNGVEETEGFIIDWPKGIATQPEASLARYDVSFYSECHTDNACAPTLVYVVQYAFNSAT